MKTPAETCATELAELVKSPDFDATNPEHLRRADQLKNGVQALRPLPNIIGYCRHCARAHLDGSVLCERCP